MSRPTSPLHPRRWLAVAVVVAVLAGGLVAWQLLRDGDRTRFSRAVELAPASTLRFSWTDWAAVRRELGADVDAQSSADEVDAFLLDAFDRDLSGVSALEESATTLQTEFGFSPATLEWELFAQGRDGAVVIMGLPDTFDTDALRQRLRELGYTEPEDADGVWRGGVDLLEGLGGPVTPELAALQLDADAGLLLGSDDPDFLAARADDARGTLDDGTAAAVAAAGDAVAASAFTGEQACSELAMSQADPADRTRASELVEAAGGVHPLTGFALAALPGGEVRATFALDSTEQARADADSRSTLAAGPAPGQGGAFPERFRVERASARDEVVTLDLAPVDGAAVLSDLNHGPVLFATC